MGVGKADKVCSDSMAIKISKDKQYFFGGKWQAGIEYKVTINLNTQEAGGNDCQQVAKSAR